MIATFGGELDDDGQGHWLTLPDTAMHEAVERGLARFCDEHQAFERAEGVTPEQFADWVADRKANPQPQSSTFDEQSSSIGLDHDAEEVVSG